MLPQFQKVKTEFYPSVRETCRVLNEQIFSRFGYKIEFDPDGLQYAKCGYGWAKAFVKDPDNCQVGHITFQQQEDGTAGIYYWKHYNERFHNIPFKFNEEAVWIVFRVYNNTGIILSDKILEETLVETWIHRRKQIEKVETYRRAYPKKRKAIQRIDIRHKWPVVVLYQGTTHESF